MAYLQNGKTASVFDPGVRKYRQVARKRPHSISCLLKKKFMSGGSREAGRCKASVWPPSSELSRLPKKHRSHYMGRWEPVGGQLGPLRFRKFRLNWDINLSSPLRLNFSLTIYLKCPPTGILISKPSWQQRSSRILYLFCSRAAVNSWLPVEGS